MLFCFYIHEIKKTKLKTVKANKQTKRNTVKKQNQRME